MIGFFNWFTKITGWLAQKLCFRTKIYYEAKKVQGRHVRGSAIVISNHTSVYDYAVFLFVLFSRTVRYQMAEVLFKKAWLRNFLKAMGGIFVDRNSNDFSFIDKSQDVLAKGGVVGVFPEGRLPKEGEARPLEFKPGVTQLALTANVPIIPLYTNGKYFQKERARVIIGKPIYVSELYDGTQDYKTNLEEITKKLRKRIVELGNELEGKIKNEKKEQKR